MAAVVQHSRSYPTLSTKNAYADDDADEEYSLVGERMREALTQAWQRLSEALEEKWPNKSAAATLPISRNFPNYKATAKSHDSEEVATAIVYMANQAAYYAQATAFVGVYIVVHCLRMACGALLHVAFAAAKSMREATGSQRQDMGSSRWRILRTRYFVDESRRLANSSPQQKIFRLGDWEDEVEDEDDE